MLDAKAFIALETTQAAVMRSGWRRWAAQHIKTLQPMLEQGQWDYAHGYVDKITMNGVVGDHFRRLEELAVSSILFGAQNVTQDLKRTSFVTGSAEIPYGMQQALNQMHIMIERDGAEFLRKELHAVIRQEELQLREPVAKEEATLYAMRPLKNSVQLIAWAKAQGFPSTLEPDDFHVTICYSKDKLEWDNISPREDTITVSGGARAVEQFGQAVVLTFDSSELQERHKDLRKAGASSDYPSYRPHITITYAGEGYDFSRVEPFTGELVFGAEEFSPLQEDWSSGVKEVRLNKAADLTLAEKLNNAVLGKGGKIIDIGANLTTSRLVSLGFLAEAIDAKMDTYQVNEVLDEKTCPVCNYMHGKTFRVENEYSRILNVLSTTDPQELKGLAPWPLQTKAGLKQLYGMSLGDMQNAGYGSPPYHPGCRGFPVLAGTVTENIPTKVSEQLVQLFEDMDPDAEDVIANDFNLADTNKLSSTHQSLAEFVKEEDNVHINKYTGSGYAMLNMYYRGDADLVGDVGNIKAMADGLMQALKPTTKTYTVYRGVSGSLGLDKALEVGDVFDMPSFTSTSRSASNAMRFARGDGSVVFQLKVPKGSSAIVTNVRECEIILPPGRSVRIIKKHLIPDNKLDDWLGVKTLIEAELVE